VTATDDETILTENIPFRKGAPLEPGEQNATISTHPPPKRTRSTNIAGAH